MNLESPLYSGFVRPELSKVLYSLGLTANTPYHYRITEGSAELNSFAFDRDDVYAQAIANLDYVKAVELVPAYQLKEIEKALPDYLLCRQNGEYEITLEKTYGLYLTITDKRLPDAFGRMLLEALKCRIMVPEKINQLITQL